MKSPATLLHRFGLVCVVMLLVSIPSRFVHAAGAYVLDSRTDFNVGVGQWSTDAMIGLDVKARFHIEASRTRAGLSTSRRCFAQNLE